MKIMTNSKEMVLAHLKISELGDKAPATKKVKGVLPALVKKSNNELSYVVVKYNDALKVYKVVYDPAPGMVTSVENIFVKSDDKKSDGKEPGTNPKNPGKSGDKGVEGESANKDGGKDNPEGPADDKKPDEAKTEAPPEDEKKTKVKGEEK